MGSRAENSTNNARWKRHFLSPASYFAMNLTAADLGRLEAASRGLVSPLTAPDPQTWLLEAGALVRDLIGGTGVVLQWPTLERPYFSEDAVGVAGGVQAYVQEVLTDGVRFSDPVVDAWNRMRRQARLETFSWDLNMRMVRERGLDPNNAPIVTDVLRGQSFHEFAGMIGETAEGEVMIWVLHPTHGGFRFGEETATLLNALSPSLRAGLDALGRLGAHRAVLDALAEPVAAFDADGREVHRNAALVHLLAAHPEASTIEVQIRRLGAQARRLSRRIDGAGLPVAEVVVRTARGGCVLRMTVLPPGPFGSDPGVLVTATPQAAPERPTPEDLRKRHGLTGREAEVALLVAEGLSNAAVAERLFVAPGTVKRHMENVLAKLEVESRAAVAARLLQAA